MTLFQPAVKEKLKARIALDGPTGSGKTWTLLQWARIIAGPDNPIGIIDTENRSAAYYAPTPQQLAGKIERLRFFDPPYEFGHMPWEGDYDPRRLVDLMWAAAEELGPDGVLGIDSLTHFWTGKGGTLDVVDGASARSGGNSYVGWKEGTPVQRNMLDAIIWCPCHVIVTMRSKMEYVLEEKANRRGEMVKTPTKVGMAPEQRAGVEYEFTVVGDMDLEHKVVISKTRCDRLDNVVAVKGTSWEPAQTFAEWLDVGVERISDATYDQIATLIAEVEPMEKRNMIRRSFKETFGNPRELTVPQVDEVYAWLDKAISDTETPPADPPADPPAAPSGDDGPPPSDDDAPPEDPPAPQKTGGRKRAAAQPTPLADALADAAPTLDEIDRENSEHNFTDSAE